MTKQNKSGFAPGKLFFMLLAVGAMALFAYSATNKTVSAETSFSESQAEQIREIVETHLKDNPEIVIEALDAYREKQQQAENRMQQENLEQFKDELFSSNEFPVAGNPEGDVTVVEFFDYNCGYCRKALPDVMEIIEADNNVRVVFVEMPILSQASHMAARWALAADKQGKYFDYHVALMNKGNARSMEDFKSIGRDLGLDIEKLEEDAMNNPEIKEQIEENIAMARALNIRGTPAFIIGDQIAPGYIGADAMRKAIADARENQDG